MNQEKCKYEYQIMTATKGQGVAIAVNCVPGVDHLNATLNCLQTHSSYIDVGDQNRENNISMGK